MNESLFSTVLSANDEAFSIFQAIYGIFVLTAIATILLIADFYRVTGAWRKVIGWMMGIGLILSFVGGSLWVFVDPAIGVYFWIYVIGILIMGVSAIATVYSVGNVKVLEKSRSEV